MATRKISTRKARSAPKRKAATRKRSSTSRRPFYAVTPAEQETRALSMLKRIDKKLNGVDVDEVADRLKTDRGEARATLGRLARRGLVRNQAERYFWPVPSVWD